MIGFFKRNRFLLMFVLLFFAANIVLQTLNPVGTLPWFVKNDFEKIVLTAGTNRFDKAFYGNSVVISAFIEDESESGFYNLGVDYGTLTDMDQMLRKGTIEVTDELVLGLNFFSFYDNFETNPTYPWHQKWYEPYLYFQRDRLYSLLTNGIGNLWQGEPFAQRKENLARSVYYGTLTDEELQDKIAVYEERYWNLPQDEFYDNYAAFESIARFCRANEIRLRVVIMPNKETVTMPQTVTVVMNRAWMVIRKYELETLDCEGLVPPEYFHDVGHLEYETGAPFFTAMIDEWLMQ